jgi:hypothetical protein
MKNISFIIITLLLILGCQEENDNIYYLSEVVYLENNELFNCQTCFSISNINANSGLIITDDISYEKYADSMRIHPINPNIDCDTATLVFIDFNKYSLIGIFTGYGACDTIKRNIINDEKNKKIIYDIDIKEYTGSCIKIYILGLNLALIPKIPDNYKVDFTVNRHK